MAGILDSKSRVIDAIVTGTGKHQIASGMLQAKFISFVDRNVFYSKDANGYLEDPGSRIYFEASSNDADLIIPETDFDGDLVPFRSDGHNIADGKVSGSPTSQTGSISTYENVASSSIENFKRQMIIGSRDSIQRNLGVNFTLPISNGAFYITDSFVSQSNGVKKAYIDDIECVFQDYRLGNIDNYKFLPPLDRPIDESISPEVLATYTQINEDPIDTYQELSEYLSSKQMFEINFSSTSNANNLLSQIFEHNRDGLGKLSVIDAGQFELDGKTFPQAYFAGKLYRDSAGNLNFVNIFTLVFE